MFTVNLVASWSLFSGVGAVSGFRLQGSLSSVTWVILSEEA